MFPDEKDYDAFDLVWNELTDETPENRSQLLGWPDVIQNSMFNECDLASQGYYLGDGNGWNKIPKAIRQQAEETARDRWMLLFQLDTVEQGDFELMFGDCGHIYFYITKEDLAARRFDRILARSSSAIKNMKHDFTIWRNQILQNPRDISPLKFGMSQDEVIEIFGNPDAVSTMRSDGKPLILKYHDIELHFDRKAPHGLYLVYSDDEIELCLTAEHEETLQPITNTEPVDNEFFLQDETVYFSGLYENSLLKGVAPKDFCCWHYWGKSSTACFLGGIRLRGADPASFRVLNYAYTMDKTAVYTTSGRIPGADRAAFQVLDNGQNDSGAPQGYAKDSRQVYFHNGDGKVKIIKGAEVSSFRSLGDTYFARDEKRIYAYGKQLPKADLPSWELFSHWYSRDAKRVYYLNREIKGADRDSFTVCTPLDAPPLADHLARDKEHFYQNDEMIEEPLWLEQLRKMTQEP